MEDFALEKEAWFRRFLELSNGIPSHDTLSDVISRLQPDAFGELTWRWVQTTLPTLAGEQVCIDDKRLRGSGAGAAAVHLVSAYAAYARLVLTPQAGERTRRRDRGDSRPAVDAGANRIFRACLCSLRLQTHP